MASAPKALILDWTMTLAKLMKEPWAPEGRPKRRISFTVGPSKPSLRSSTRQTWVVWVSCHRHKKAETAWDSTVARAAASTPQPSTATNSRSRTTLSTEDKMR